MTPEDKRMICEYMKDAGWFIKNDEPLYILRDKLKTQTEGEGYWAFDVKFDLNDAGLCVKEMVRRGDLVSFEDYYVGNYYMRTETITEFIMDADNFFNALVGWLKCKS